MAYTPPYTVSAKAISMVAEISALVERYVMRLEGADALMLRKANRIKTIQGSLAIEGNSLSESQITDIINGKPVIAPLREVQEVKNAIAAYEAFPTFNAFAWKDLLRAHGLMMTALVDGAGQFRRCGVGVFSGGRPVHIAPPAERVPALIGDLFDWLKNAEDHLLIRSCVFHYEFEFIHPFADGNGRMGRMWQSLILTKLNPVFQHLPVETIVHDHQQEYYRAINESSAKSNCGPFIDFMLERILETLKMHKGQKKNVLRNVPRNVPRKQVSLEDRILKRVKSNPKVSAVEIANGENMSLKSIQRAMKVLKDKGVLKRIGSTKGGYWEIIEEMP